MASNQQIESGLLSLGANASSAGGGQPTGEIPVSSPAFMQVLDLLGRIAEAVEMGAPEGLAAKQAAAFIGVSESKFRALDAAGLVPAPAKIGNGNCPRWPASELKVWLLAGSPTRITWNAIRDSTLGVRFNMRLREVV